MTTSTHDTQRLEAAIHRVREYAIARVSLMARQLLTQVSITSGRSISTITTEDIVNYLQIAQHSRARSIHRSQTRRPISPAPIETQDLAIEAVPQPKSSPTFSGSPRRPHRSQEDFEQSLMMLDRLFSDASTDPALN